MAQFRKISSHIEGRSRLAGNRKNNKGSASPLSLTRTARAGITEEEAEGPHIHTVFTQVFTEVLPCTRYTNTSEETDTVPGLIIILWGEGEVRDRH